MSAMRVGIDIDGVLADMDGAASNAPAGKLPVDFWENLAELEPGMVKQLAATAAAEQWQLFFLTRRPETGGDPAQIQTERWLERHGFARPCVHIVRGSRGKLVHALGLDLLIDDTLDNCLDAALESKAASILIWSGDPTHARRSLRGMNVDLAASLGDVLEQMTGRAVVRNRRSASAPTTPIATADKSSVATQTPLAAADKPTFAPTSPIATADRLTRRTFAIAAALFGAFAVYGSLVPLQYRAMPIDEALARFAQVPYLALGVGSRADFVSNILLFIPLAFLLSGVFLVDRRGAVRLTMAAALILSFAFALSVAIEFTQVFFPPRTVSLNDIVAETTGAAIGVALWGMFGPGLTAWTRAFLREQARPTLVVRLLQAYGVGFLVSLLIPFDITLDLGELAQKYDEGRIVLVPFGYMQASRLGIAWDLVTDILLWVPLGILASIGLALPDARRSHVAAMVAGALVVVLIEIAQLFVFTRYADVTDLLTGSLGIALGIVVANWSARPQMAHHQKERHAASQLWPAIAFLAWIVGLAFYNWAPFDFVLDRELLRQRLAELWVAPFRNYYYGSEFQAFSGISRKLMLAIPVGALLRLMLSSHPNRSAGRIQNAAVLVVGLALFAGLEAGQMLVPGRFPDLTDVLIALAGVEGGRRLVEWLRYSELRPAGSSRTVQAVADEYPPA